MGFGGQADSPGFDIELVADAPLGLLIIDVIDPAHVQLVWRAWAETNLTMEGPNRLSGLIKAVVAHTLANFSSKS